jgi:ABC-type multidrug transport system fused ATPase/permease subunit
MSDGETALKNVANCVPQVYTDIIGRVIPGTLIMGSIWMAICGPEEFFSSLGGWLEKSTISSVTLATVLVFLTSYILAILIWCFVSYLNTILWQKYGKPESTKMEWFRKIMYWDDDGFHKKYEKLKYYNTAAGNRVTKLKAQIQMVETLFVGFPLSVFLGIIYSKESNTYLFVSCVFMLIAAFCSFFARQYFIDHMNNSLDKNLELLGEEKSSNKGKSEKDKETS